MNTDKVRIAAVADIHIGEHTHRSYTALFEEISVHADILLLCGDITNRGLPEEARLLAEELAACKVPVVAVLGNHDYESDKADELKAILLKRRIVLLDGDAYEFNGVGFAGVKGFGGGFGSYMLAPWGETAIKNFVHEAVNESLRLESALSTIKSEKKVVLMHYSPIMETVKGEPPEIFPFLGTSRLEEPINLHDVKAVFHGHAHMGTPEGKTSKGIPVFNVSYPIMVAQNPDRPYRIVEI